MTYCCFLVPSIRCVSCVDTITRTLNQKKQKLNIQKFHLDVTDKKLHVWFFQEQSPSTNFFPAIQKILSKIGHNCCELKFNFYLPKKSLEQKEKIEQLIKSYEDLKIKNIAIDLKKKSLNIEVDTLEGTEQELCGEIEARLKSVGIKCINPYKNHNRINWIFGGLGVVLGLGLMSVCMFAPPLGFPLLLVIGALSTILTLTLGMESFKTAFRGGRHFTMDSLFTISAFTILTISIASLFIPGLPMMFEAGLLMFGFRRLGLGLENTMVELTTKKKLYRDKLPKEVSILQNGLTIQKPIYEIKENEELLLNPKEAVPVDGLCLETILVNYKDLTGQDDIVQLNNGEKISAGGIVLSGGRIKATTSTKNSSLAKADQILLDSSSEPSPLEKTTGKFFRYFIPIVLGVSLLSGGLIGIFYGLTIGIQCAMAVLVSACPCTLGMIVPLSMKIGMQRALRHGVYFNNAKALQDASDIDTVVFDWNGTVTSNIITVTNHGSSADFTDEKLLHYTCLLEADSAHPIGIAIKDYVQRKKTYNTDDITFQSQILHSGISALINHEEVLIGNQSLMQQNNIQTHELDQQLDQELQASESAIYLAVNGQVKGYFIIRVPLRRDAKFVVNTLMQSKKVNVCTGTHRKNIIKDTSALGIPEENIYTDLIAFPDGSEKRDKSAIIKHFPGRVAMIGDWSNDALAVDESAFSIAIQNEKRTLSASASIQDDTLMPVLNAFVIAEETVRNIKQNLALSFTYNILSMVLASGILLTVGLGVMNPGLCVALMFIQSALIFYNAYRLKNQTLDHLKNNNPPNKNVVRQELDSYQKMRPALGYKRAAIRISNDPIENSTLEEKFCCNNEAQSSKLDFPIELISKTIGYTHN